MYTTTTRKSQRVRFAQTRFRIRDLRCSLTNHLLDLSVTGREEARRSVDDFYCLRPR